MTALNLGDSGFLLIRFNQDDNGNEPYVLIRSKEQTHYFNTPYQLTRLPGQKEVDNLKKQNKTKEVQSLQKALNENNFCCDSPEDSDIYQMRVREGDLLIMATDGVFDNLFEDEIVNTVAVITARNRGQRSKQVAMDLSKAIAEAAKERSMQMHVKTPFHIRKADLIVEYRKQMGSPMIGGNEANELDIKVNGDCDYDRLCYGKGKMDDITVLTMWISRRGDE